MAKLIAACGLDCAACPAYIAAMTDDEALRKKTAEEWSRAYGFDCKPEMVNCHGCLATDGVQIGHCAECEIRACAVKGKSFPNCAACADFSSCAKLSAFLANAEEARKNLAALRA
jgi:hypothetical protein